MDSSLYKDTTVSRGLVYRYFASPARDADKPTLLLLHGFPSTSEDWRAQVPFFRNEGYGVIVPDMLGYGGTAAPEDPAAYVASLIVKDLVDILDAEKVSTVVAIGHDWGSKIAGRLANYYPDRFIAFGFLAVGYLPPSTDNNYEPMLAFTKKVFGFELFGYWRFFSEPDAVKLVEDNIESFLSLLYSADPQDMAVHFAPLGALRAFLSKGEKAAAGLASYITAEEVDHQKKKLLATGITGPSNWYKIMTSGLDAEDNKGVPPANIVISKPAFFGGCKKDLIARSDLQLKALGPTAPQLTYHEFDASHWVLWESKDEVNEELSKWLKTL